LRDSVTRKHIAFLDKYRRKRYKLNLQCGMTQSNQILRGDPKNVCYLKHLK